MTTRAERRERVRAKFAPTRTKLLYLIVFLLLYLTLIWAFIQIVKLRTTNGLIPAMAATLILLILLLFNREWRQGTTARALYAGLIILLFAGVGASAVAGGSLDSGFFVLLLAIFVLVAAVLFTGLRIPKRMVEGVPTMVHQGKAFPLFLLAFFIILAATVSGVQAVQAVPFLLLLITFLLVLFLAITGLLVFLLDTVFWEGH